MTPIHCTPPRIVRARPSWLHAIAVEVRFDGQRPIGMGRRDDLSGDLAVVCAFEGRR